MQTLKNAEQFMVTRDYRTAAELYTVALQSVGVPASPDSVASILCKRAECLLRLVSIFHKRFFLLLFMFVIQIEVNKKTCTFFDGPIDLSLSCSRF